MSKDSASASTVPSPGALAPGEETVVTAPSSQTVGLALAAGGIGIVEWRPAPDRIAWTRPICPGRAPHGHGIDALLDAVHVDDREAIGAALRAAVADTESFVTRFRPADYDARPRWIEFRATVLRNSSGEAERLLGVFSDSPEQEDSQELLRRRVEELEKIRDIVPGLVWIAHDAACTQITGNERAQRLLSAPPDSNVSANDPEHRRFWIRQLRAGRELEANELPLQKALASRSTVEDFDLRLETADGRVVDLLGNAAPLFDDDGAVRGGVAVFVDISARKRAEEALHDAVARLAETDRQKDEFLAMLGHELRNPLGAIRAAVDLNRATGSGIAGSNRTDEIVSRQLKHLTRLVDDLLDVSRVTQGAIGLVKSPVDLVTTVYTGVELARSAIDSKRHRFVLTMPPPNSLWIDGDAARIAQVIGNLLNNAAKFTPAEGAIDLGLRRVGDAAEMTIADTGEGLSPEFLPRAFDVFSQADRSEDRKHGGLGIGLALVKRIVEMHGGDVTLASPGLGCGTTVTVRLPLRTAPAIDRVPPRDTVAQAARRILIVDDNVDFAASVGELLEREGHAVAYAHDGLAAIATADAFRPDLLLVDIGLPLLNGYAVCERLRAMPAHASATFVAITGYGRPEDEARCRAAGFQHHLVKPVDPMLLRAIVAHPGRGD